MNLVDRVFRTLGPLVHTALAGLLAGSAAGAAPAALLNAAQRKYGARFEVAAGPGARKDPQTEPEAAFDGNPHTRLVMTGVPYTFTVELLDRLPIEKIGFANSDYASEQAPREVEITLEDGSVIRHTLEVKRPVKRQPVWQEVPLGKSVRTLKITALANHPGSEKVNWGGLGEIALWTSADLEKKFQIPGHNPTAAAFVHLPPGPAARGDVPVRLPPPAPPGEHPRLLLTRAELAELRAALPATERGAAALAALVKVAEGALGEPLEFPDPQGPLGQMKDRGDAVAKRHDRLSLNCGTLALAYALTGQAAYAQRAAEILKGYTQRYEAYPEHKGVNKSDTGKVMGQRLSEAMWLIPLIEAFDYIHESGALTEADRQLIGTQLLRPAVTFIRRKAPAAEIASRNQANPNWRTAPQGKAASNWLLFYNTATMMTGAVLGDRDLVDLAAADFRELIHNGIGADGMWGEGAIGYQFFALSALTPGLETAARQGIDLWSQEGGRVKTLFDSPLRYAYPDGSAPGINDSGRARFGDWSTMSYDYAWLRYGDLAYAFLVNGSPRQLHFSQAVYFPTRVYAPLAEPAATSYPSTVFDNLGYAILRQPNLYALVDYGPHGGVHGHWDKLNLLLFAQAPGSRGDELGGEPVFHRYEDPLHDEWTKQTVAHNSLAVDGASQMPTTGKLLVFEDTPEVKIMRAESAGACAGALLDRTVVVLPDAVLDLYCGRSATPRDWDRTFRFQGPLSGFPGLAAPTEPLGRRDGYQHLHVAARQSAAAPWQGEWATKAGPFQVRLAGAEGQQLFLCRGPDQEQMALARQSGKEAAFAAVYQLKNWPHPAGQLRWLPPGNSSVQVCELTQPDGAVTRVFLAPKGAPWEAEGWRCDARVLYVQQQGGRSRVLLCGGTFAENGKRQLRLASAGNALAEGAGDQLSLQSTWAPEPETKPKPARARAKN